jgi:tetratricopeptide (TPR) repeat protein
MAQNEPAVVVEEMPSLEEMGALLKSMQSSKKTSPPPPPKKTKGILDRLNGLFRGEKGRIVKELEQTLNLIRKEPGNTKARVKIAEIYQKMGKEEKAISEYLKAAEIFCKKDLWPQAMAVYKQILKLDPSQEEVHRCVSEIYHRLGFLGDAFSQYNVLLRQYHTLGEEEKSIEILSLMAELNPQKFALDNKTQISKKEPENLEKSAEGAGQETIDLEIPPAESSKAFFDLCAELQKKTPKTKQLKIAKEICMEKLFGFDEILKELQDVGGTSRVYPNFNFQMGLACREMGFLDEAIEQFQLALEKGQEPLEAAHLMGLCYREKGWWEEARRSFRVALDRELIPEEKERLIRKDLELLPTEHDLTGEAMDPDLSVKDGDLEGENSEEGKPMRKKYASRGEARI